MCIVIRSPLGPRPMEVSGTRHGSAPKNGQVSHGSLRHRSYEDIIEDVLNAYVDHHELLALQSVLDREFGGLPMVGSPSTAEDYGRLWLEHRRGP